MSASIQLEYSIFPSITVFCDATPCIVVCIKTQAVVTWMEVLSGDLPGGTEKYHENRQENQCPGRGSSWAAPEYKSEVSP
jgi:hypothetical protein